MRMLRMYCVCVGMLLYTCVYRCVYACVHACGNACVHACVYALYSPCNKTNTPLHLNICYTTFVANVICWFLSIHWELCTPSLVYHSGLQVRRSLTISWKAQTGVVAKSRIIKDIYHRDINRVETTKGWRGGSAPCAVPREWDGGGEGDSGADR